MKSHDYIAYKNSRVLAALTDDEREKAEIMAAGDAALAKLTAEEIAQADAELAEFFGKI